MRVSSRLTLAALLTAAVLLPAIGFGCSSAHLPGDEVRWNPPIDWSAAADSSTGALIENYWSARDRYFYYGNLGDPEFHYWPQAHALDVVLDAYSRTGEEAYRNLIDAWHEGVYDRNDGWINDYYDDMEWNALAMLRAYRMTGDEKFRESVDVLWENIKTGWTEVSGGGIMWSKPTPNSKNAISNAPASILASRLYQLTGEDEYLEWARKTYDWQQANLVDRSTGAVWDHIVVENGEEEIRKDWIFTYNQGMYLGASLELYEITDNPMYLNEAVKAADYALSHLTTGDRLLKPEGSGDGGLFKGILVRYLTQLILEEDLDQAAKNRYADFLRHNARTLWAEGTDKEDVLYDTYWKEKPDVNEEIDLTVQLSGAMLMEAAARLEQEGALEQ